MNRCPISPAQALAALTPEFMASLSAIERLVLPFMLRVWMRPEQLIPLTGWRSYGYICGRGWGKTFAIAAEINNRVLLGRAKHLGLLCTDEDRADELQITALVETAPPWFQPVRYKGGLKWPNGVRAIVFTPNAPEEPRGENMDLGWMSEIVAWRASTRKAAFDNFTTAVRLGRHPQYFWDTTSKGLNETIRFLLERAQTQPRKHRLVRGTIFDNPLLPREYLEEEVGKYRGRRAKEELLGEVFTSAAGALFDLATIELHRRPLAPTGAEIVIAGIDPAHSAEADADDTGIVWGSRGQDGHVYALEDRSCHEPPDKWGLDVIDTAIQLRASGAVLERTGLGDHARGPIVSAAKTRGIQVKVLPRDKPIPRYQPGVFHLREVVAARAKLERAEGPAAEMTAGRVHHVGESDHWAELELELCTYAGVGESPNRFDAYVHMTNELASLTVQKTKPRPEATNVAKAQEVLRTELRRIGRGLRVGL